MKTYLEAVLLWKMSGTKSDALKVCCKVAVRNWMMRGDDFFSGFFCFFVVQSGAVFLATCCILEPKSLICMFFVAFWS